MDLLYPLSGFVVGLIVGLTGVGGGSLMTPLLVLLFGVSPATAVGTDLLYASITKAGGVLVHHQRGSVNWKVVGLLALGSVPASILTTLLIHSLGVDTERMAAVIKVTLGVALLLTAVAILFRRKLAAFALHHHWPHPSAVVPFTIIAGALLGMMVTISSVGAGAVGVAALFLLYPALHATKIIGSDIAHAVPLTLVAGLGHAALGSVDYGLLVSLLIGSLPGIWLGSHLCAKVPEHWLRRALATMLVLVGGKLVI